MKRCMCICVVMNMDNLEEQNLDMFVAFEDKLQTIWDEQFLELEEGIYISSLTTELFTGGMMSNDLVSDESNETVPIDSNYKLIETQMPKEISTLLGNEYQDDNFRAFYISGSGEAHRMLLWCDYELLSLEDSDQIFYYNEEEGKYQKMEVSQLSGSGQSGRRLHRILNFYVFQVEVNKGEDAEKYPIVLIEGQG